MRFGVIFWRSDPALTWREGLMQQGSVYRGYRSAGVEPDMYAVINWTGAPDVTLREWPVDGVHPFMSAVREFAVEYVPEAR